jgi:hypothetical protein
LLAFVYHCLDRIVIQGYVTCRPEHVIYFFREVVGVPLTTKEISRQRTEAYQSWVEPSPAIMKSCGWTAREIHQAVLTTFGLSESAYGLNQLRYDLRKLKGHGLLERNGASYAYSLTPQGRSGRVAIPVLP